MPYPEDDAVSWATQKVIVYRSPAVVVMSCERVVALESRSAKKA